MTRLTDDQLKTARENLVNPKPKVTIDAKSAIALISELLLLRAECRAMQGASNGNNPPLSILKA